MLELLYVRCFVSFIPPGSESANKIPRGIERPVTKSWLETKRGIPGHLERESPSSCKRYVYVTSIFGNKISSKKFPLVKHC